MSDADREIVLSRIIEGPRALVFAVYTDPKHLSQWFGPNGFTLTTRSFDLRVGGAWSFVMHGPDGTDYTNHIEWRAIDPPARLVYEQGERANDPNAFTSTIVFDDVEGGTRITMRTLFRTKERRAEVVEKFGAIEGGQQHLERFAAFVAQERP